MSASLHQPAATPMTRWGKGSLELYLKQSTSPWNMYSTIDFTISRAPRYSHGYFWTNCSTTLMHTNGWQALPRKYLNKPLVVFFISDITWVFRIECNWPPSILKLAQNLDGALQHHEVVNKYNIAVEVAKQCTVRQAQSSNLLSQSSCQQVIPKNHNPNKWRLIVDLSC